MRSGPTRWHFRACICERKCFTPLAKGSMAQPEKEPRPPFLGHLSDETVHCEAEALNYLTGDVRIHAHVISTLGGVIKSLLADEAVYRPTYSGTGVVTLESSLGGYHVLDLDGETWILDRGAYWASEGSVEVGYRREPVLTARVGRRGPDLPADPCPRRGPSRVDDSRSDPGTAAGSGPAVRGGRQLRGGPYRGCVAVRARPTKNWLGRGPPAKAGSASTREPAACS